MPLPRPGGRALAFAAVALLLLPAQGRQPGGLAVVHAQPRFVGAGVSAAVAAARLNALAKKDVRRAARSPIDVHFILNWLPNVEFAGLWVAEQQGMWRRAGIRMTYTPYSQAVHPETDVATHPGINFGFQSGAAIAIARAQGVPITALYTDTQKSVFGLTVMAKSGIKKLRDLRGKRVGYQPHELYVPETMLAYVGLKSNEWQPVPVLFDIDQLTSGRVDAFLTFVTNEPINLQLRGIKAKTFPAADYGFHFYDDVLCTRTALIGQKPGLVRKVVSIVARGFRYAHTHVRSTAQLTTRLYYPAKGVSARYNLRQQTLELQRFTPYSRDRNGRFTGLMDTATWRASINTLFRYGEIKSKPNPATIYTNRFNPYR